MRLAVLGLGLAFAVAPPLAAQPPVAANEVLLEVNALGTSTKQADLATFSVSLRAEGASEAEARGALAEKIRRLTAAVTGAGVAANDVQTGPVRLEGSDLRTFDVAEEPPPPADEPPPGSTGRPSPPVPIAERGRTSEVSTTLMIRVRDMSRVVAVRDEVGRVEGNYALFSTAPVFTLAEPGLARSEARMRALASARADAEAYAAALNMRVARMVRVTDRVGVDLIGLLMSEPGRRSAIAGPETTRDGEVLVTVPVGVDFVLAPR